MTRLICIYSDLIIYYKRSWLLKPVWGKYGFHSVIFWSSSLPVSPASFVCFLADGVDFIFRHSFREAVQTAFAIPSSAGHSAADPADFVLYHRYYRSSVFPQRQCLLLARGYIVIAGWLFRGRVIPVRPDGCQRTENVSHCRVHLHARFCLGNILVFQNICRMIFQSCW